MREVLPAGFPQTAQNTTAGIHHPNGYPIRAQGFAAEAIETLVLIMRDDAVPPQTRVAAINALLDRAMGKPRQELEHAGSEPEPLTVIIREFVKPPGY